MLKRTLAGIIRSFEQTGDAANDPALKTRYYKMPREKLWEEVISLLKKTPNYELLHEMESVGEIVLSKKTVFGRTQDITLTILKVGPNKSSIDIYSASRGSLGDLGSNYRTIVDLFKLFDTKFAQYKSVDS